MITFDADSSKGILFDWLDYTCEVAAARIEAGPDHLETAALDARLCWSAEHLAAALAHAIEQKTRGASA
jgi:hypothetical protein